MKAIYHLVWISVLPLFGFAQSSVENIESHFVNIIDTDQYRNYRNVETLDMVASYIGSHFKKYADTTYFQTYKVDGKEYKNVIAVFGTSHSKTIVVGAHYDVCGDQDGADDNASGVVGILEMARMLQGKKLNYKIELVAFTLEEPPFFRTRNMGSYQHAKSLSEAGRDVYGMVALDMIGYFSESKKSQHYPLGIMSWFYGKKGDYIMIANKWGKGKFARKLRHRLKRSSYIKVKSLAGPKSVEGLDWSDHLNYWNFGYSASMLTDTGPNRNRNYHRKSDNIETIDFAKTGKVIDSLFEAILTMK